MPPARAAFSAVVNAVRIPDALDHDVGAAIVGTSLDLDDRVHLRRVDGRRADLLGELQPVLGHVHHVDHRRLVREHAHEREQPDGTGAGDRDDVALLDLGPRRDVGAGREDVSCEYRLLVRQRGIDGVEVPVGDRDAHVLGLRAVEVPDEHPVSEDPHLVAVVELAARAEPAGAADDQERADDAVARLELRDVRAGVHDLADELVAHHAARPHAGDAAVDEMQVRAADRRRRHLDDRVAGVQDLGFGIVAVPELAHVFEQDRAHRLPP